MDVGIIEQQKDRSQSIVDTTLSARQFYQHDPLLVLLKDKLHLNNLWISASVMFLPGIIYPLWWLLAMITSNESSLGWNLHEWLSIIIQTFVLFPLLFLIYTFIPGSIAKIFNTLDTSGVIGIYREDRSNIETYTHFKKKMLDWIDNSWWTVIIVVVIMLYIFIKSLAILNPANQYNLSPMFSVMRTISIISFIPLMFATGMNVIRLVLALIFINRLFYLFTLRVKPMHLDGSGGLALLERLIWLCVSMMLWLVILLLVALLTRRMIVLSYPEMFILGAIYIMLIPALIIGCLVFPHRMMVNARNEALQPLTIEYQQALMQSLSSGAQDTQGIADEALRLEALKKRYDLVYNSFSVWPLDTNALSRAGITVILPIILPIIFPSIMSFFTLALQRLGI